MLKQAAKRQGVKKVMVADAENIPYNDNFFDVVNTSQFLMHTPFYKKVISEMARVAKKGGSLIIDFPNKHSLSYFPTKFRIYNETYRHYNLFRKKEILEIAKENNLEIKEIKGTVVISPMYFPKFAVGFAKNLNKALLKLFPNLTYTYYVYFIKK